MPVLARLEGGPVALKKRRGNSRCIPKGAPGRMVGGRVKCLARMASRPFGIDTHVSTKRIVLGRESGQQNDVHEWLDRHHCVAAMIAAERS